MNIPPVCAGVIKKKDYQKYLDWKKSGEKHMPYGLHTYRVTHHLKEVPILDYKSDDGIIDDFINEGLAERRKKYRSRLKYCIPDEATWISGCGVCGILLPITEIIMLEKNVGWSEERVKEEKESAVSPFWLNMDSLTWITHEGEISP